jgi:hypothetical protein
VTVKDTEAPVITLNGASPLTLECHAPFADPGATATDLCAGSVAVSSSGAVDANTPGSYTITYGATDDIGLKAIEKPTHFRDIHTTILHQLGLAHQRMWPASPLTARRRHLPRARIGSGALFAAPLGWMPISSGVPWS